MPLIRRLTPFILALFLLFTSFSALLTYTAEAQEPIYLVFVWHYHQPWYLDEYNNSFLLPWVRMHSVGNYFKMGYILSKYPDVKAVFTFPGSLLKQIELYLAGIKDYRLILSEKIAKGENLTVDERFDMLKIPGGFFDINWNRIVNVVPRFRELRDRAQSALNRYVSLPEEDMKRAVVSEFTDQDFLDLAVLFNLFWIDPQVLRELYPDVYELRVKALSNTSVRFTREDLAKVLGVQMDIMSKVYEVYKQLASRGHAELIPVPYSHPLAPIVADFGWLEDLEIHVEKSLELFEKYFGYRPKGVWPAEQAINDYVAEIFAEKGFLWTVTDQSILGKSGVDGSDPRNYCYPWIAEYSSRTIYVFFRDTELSNLISFTYSNWNAAQAVEDLLSKVVSRGRAAGPGAVVVIALDGENPWENYEEFGDVFLNTLYSRISELQKQGVLKTVTPSEYLETHGNYARRLQAGPRLYLDLAGRDISDIPLSYTRDAYGDLPRRTVTAQLGEGSWAGGEVAIWIGQRQENAAWMLLAKAREDLLRILNVSSLREAMRLNPVAVEYLLMAEASDWFWWYGGDGGGTFPSNPLFRGYLRNIYRALGVEPPQYLLGDFNPDATPAWTLNTEAPKPVESPPKIDGSIDSAEWRGSLNISVGGSAPYVLVAVDSENIYIAAALKEPGAEIAVYFTNVYRSVSPYHPGYNALPRCGKSTIGMGLFYEVYIDPAKRTVKVSAADGRGGWVELFTVSEASFSGRAFEASIPWRYLSLSGGDLTYLVVAVCRGGELEASSQRLGMVHYIVVPRSAAAVAGRVVLDVADPEGDDVGAGTYVYPKNTVFKPGVFDLTRFRVVDRGDRLVFYVYVKDLGGNPWGGPNGFCLQYTHIYIRTTQADLLARTDTFGLNVNLTDDSAWHFALLLAPGWGGDPVPIGERAALYYANGTVVVQDGVFSVYVDAAENAVVAEVAKSVLPDADNADKWVYTVVLTSYDGYGSDRIRSFAIDAAEWTVGVGRDLAASVALGVVPRIMDLLALAAEAQYSMLRSFVADVKTGQAVPARISGINASLVAAPPQPTTVTITSTITVTATTTVASPTTTTIYSVTTSPLTIRELSIELLTAASIAMIVLGLALGFLLVKLRRK